MSEPKVEPLGGGLVLSRDPSLLQEGELQVAEDVMLKPGSPSLFKVRGRVAFNDVSPAGIDALGYAPFEGDPHQLVLLDGGEYQIAPAELEGNFVGVGDGAGESLKVVPVLDRAVLLTGSIDEGNKVLLSDGTLRPHGLRPVTATPDAIHSASGGTWPLGDDLGWFEYWTTEVYIVGEGADEGEEEVEGTFTGTPKSVEVTATTSYVTITAPDVVNDQATHWRVYRSDRKDTEHENKFPLGWLIATIPISQRSFTDGLPSTAGPSPATATAIPGELEVPLADGTIEVLLTGFTTDTDNILLNDGNVATSFIVKRDTTTFPGITLKTISQVVLRNFGFTNITMPITGITLSIEGSKAAVVNVVAHLSWDGGNSWTDGKSVGFTTGNTTVTVGGDAWGRTWNSDEFLNGAFEVLLVISSNDSTGGQASFDYLTATITYNSTTSALVDQFPNVQLTIGGKKIPIGANGFPPGATTGTWFQGSLVMNDAENPEELVWSVPGTIDYFPFHYRLVIGDPILSIDTLGSICILGCRGSMIHLNYVPNADDPEFNTGRAYDVFEPGSGVSGLHATTTFTLNGQLMLFYISSNDLKITNGFTTTNAVDDLNWADIANIGLLHEAFVEHNTLDHEILVFYPSPGSDHVDKILRLQYHPTHLKNGKMKIAGITNYACDHVTGGVSPSGERRIYTAVDREIFLENRGFIDESGQGINPRIETREAHLAGIGNSWEAPRIGIHHGEGGGDVAVTLRSAMANNPIYEAGPASVDTSPRRLSLVDKAHSGDGLSVEIVGQDDGLPLQINYLVFFADDLGPTTPMKT